MADEWITTGKAAKISGYTTRRIRQLIDTGEIKGQKFGHVWQVDEVSLIAYVRKAEKMGEKRGPKSKD